MSIDHRRIGQELGLFALDEQLGAGLPMWLPRGAAIRRELESFVLELERRAGYQHVYTPPLAKRALYEQSGHWDHFRDDMFPPMRAGRAADEGANAESESESESDSESLVLRPMNCPHHMRVFAQGERSYRELPLRIAELGAMFRDERSGVISGLSRVRYMTLNDGHVFCREDQVAAEVAAIISLIQYAYELLGVEPHRWRLSMRGDGGKYVANDAMWARSEDILRGALDEAGIAFEEGAGEAAFYGPKIDVQVIDAAGREETLSTVQVDFHLPDRFGLGYVGEDGGNHRVIVVHRSLVSTMERMVAYLLERYEGALPCWLSPVQVVVLPVTDAPAVRAAADRVLGACLASDLRAEMRDARDTLGARIRRSAAEKVPYVAVVGEREAVDGSVSVRERDSQPDRRTDERLPALAFVARVHDAVRSRRR
jgi:threonyl-tRNA synthetase